MIKQIISRLFKKEELRERFWSTFENGYRLGYAQGEEERKLLQEEIKNLRDNQLPAIKRTGFKSG